MINFSNEDIRNLAKVLTDQIKKMGEGSTASKVAQMRKKEEIDNTIRASNALDRFIKAVDAHNKSSEKDFKTAKEQSEALNDLRKQQSEAFKILEADTSSLGQVYKKIAQDVKHGDVTSEEATVRRIEADKKLDAQLKETTKHVSKFGHKLFWWAEEFVTAKSLWTAATNYMQDFSLSMKYGTDVTSTVFENMSAAARLGIDPRTLQEIGARTRMVENAMGGMQGWIGALDRGGKSLFTHVGSLTDTYQFTANMLQTLGQSGIKPTIGLLENAQGGLSGLTKTFDQAQRLTGQTFEQSAIMLKDFTENADIRFRLTAAASGKERATILRGIMARQNELTAVLGSADAAKRATEALEHMAGKNPKERWKEAAKLQAMAGAMGMGEQGARMAEILRKGRRATPEEQKDFAVMLGKMNDKLAKSTTGAIGDEFTMAAMQDKLNLQEFMGPNGPFNTTLGQGLKEAKKTADKITTLSDQKTAGSWIIDKSMYYKQYVENNAKTNANWQALLGSGGVLWLMLKQLSIIGAGSVLGGLKSLPGMLKGGMGGILKRMTAAGAAEMVGGSAAGGLAATLGTGAVAGGAGYFAGHEIYKHALAGNKVGDAVGSMIAHVLAFFGSADAQEAINRTAKTALTHHMANVPVPPAQSMMSGTITRLPPSVMTPSERKAKADEEARASKSEQQSTEMTNGIKSIGANTGMTNDYLNDIKTILAKSHNLSQEQADTLKKVAEKKKAGVYGHTPIYQSGSQ